MRNYAPVVVQQQRRQVLVRVVWDAAGADNADKARAVILASQLHQTLPQQHTARVAGLIKKAHHPGLLASVGDLLDELVAADFLYCAKARLCCCGLQLLYPLAPAGRQPHNRRAEWCAERKV